MESVALNGRNPLVPVRVRGRLRPVGAYENSCGAANPGLRPGLSNHAPLVLRACKTDPEDIREEFN